MNKIEMIQTDKNIFREISFLDEITFVKIADYAFYKAKDNIEEPTVESINELQSRLDEIHKDLEKIVKNINETKFGFRRKKLYSKSISNIQFLISGYGNLSKVLTTQRLIRQIKNEEQRTSNMCIGYRIKKFNWGYKNYIDVCFTYKNLNDDEIFEFANEIVKHRIVYGDDKTNRFLGEYFNTYEEAYSIIEKNFNINKFVGIDFK